MAYEKNTWATGDVVTAEKLNHMENGIESAGGGSSAEVLVITITQTSETTFTGESSMTEQEMFNFFLKEKEIDGETVYEMRNNLPIVIKDSSLPEQYFPSRVSAFYYDEEFEFILGWSWISIGEAMLKACYIDYANSRFIGEIAYYNLGPQ